MLEERHGHEDGSCNILKFHNNEFYNAIMDEDSERTDSMLTEYGSNSIIQVQQGVPGMQVKGLTVIPLHLAASYRRVKSLRQLLFAGANPDMRDKFGRSTLHLLIASWPNLCTGLSKSKSRFPAAVVSAQRQAEACLMLLCEHGANVNAEVEGESHQTALHLSVRYTALSAVHVLSSYGAKINAVDCSGMTPLHMAAGILHKDLVASLIKEGANVNMEVKHSGNTPLHLAVVSLAMKSRKTLRDDFSCASELLNQGAKVNAVNKAGFTPLHEACSMGNEELVDLLLRHGANINELSEIGENCLFLFLNHRANVRNESLLVKLLCLTSPLTVYNHSRILPHSLTLPCFLKQRDQILRLTQQPRRFQDMCKCEIYQRHIQGGKEVVRKILPKKLFDFVFESWDNVYNISFKTDEEQDSFTNSLRMAPSGAQLA